jgi:IS1 family transposase
MLNEPAVIAYPVDNSPSRRSTSSLAEDNVYSSSIGDSKFADDTIEMSGNFFSQVRLWYAAFATVFCFTSSSDYSTLPQLDSMIAAVKVESSALDSMKEKLKEVENLRNQISNFTKRLLDADQANLNLKANLVKVQEMYAEVKKAKAEVGFTVTHLMSTCGHRCVVVF